VGHGMHSVLPFTCYNPGNFGLHVFTVWRKYGVAGLGVVDGGARGMN